MKSVQISRTLFVALMKYHCLDDVSQSDYIKQELEAKLNKMVQHERYTDYKTAGSEEEKEKARIAYLDSKGVSSDFRW